MKVMALLSEKYLNKTAVNILSDEDIVIYYDAFAFLTDLMELSKGIVLCDETLFWELLTIGGLKTVIQNTQILLIIICKNTQSQERIRLLESGADNIWSYDFHIKELHARIKACQRFLGSYSNKETAKTSVQHLTIDQEKKIALLEGKEIPLTASEFLILNCLVTHPKRIYAREELMTLMKTSGVESTVRVIDTHIKNLRKKIEKNPADSQFIKTVHGRGYRFDPNDEG